MGKIILLPHTVFVRIKLNYECIALIHDEDPTLVFWKKSKKYFFFLIYGFEIVACVSRTGGPVHSSLSPFLFGNVRCMSNAQKT